MATLGILRELHRWGAHAMVITIWLHMYRVFLTGSYKPPREFNWGVGVILLVLTLLLSFTGYLLPWDQLAIWAITVGSNMARATPLLGYEGPGATFLQVGGVPLIHSGSDARFLLLGGRFVAARRCCASTCCTASPSRWPSALLIAIHFWRVRKDGGISGASVIPLAARAVSSSSEPRAAIADRCDTDRYSCTAARPSTSVRLQTGLGVFYFLRRAAERRLRRTTSSRGKQQRRRRSSGPSSPASS